MRLPSLPSSELFADIADALAGWYHTRRRILPWREDPTPYRVWVSELMLQQTQVVTVLPYFERWMQAFPTLESLAQASEDDVLSAWSGLGYYRRARFLHAGAKHIMSELGGAFPHTVETLLTLPGIGRYTAGAIASIAFGVQAPLLDGNVARVLSRLFAVELEADSTAGLKVLWELAEELVPARDPSSHNQALMELGALVCTPRSPLCKQCPLSDRCEAYALGEMERFPLKKPKKAPTPVQALSALCLSPDGTHVLLAQRPLTGLLAGLWELPTIEVEGTSLRPDALTTMFQTRLNLQVESLHPLTVVKHQFSHRSLTLHIHRVQLLSPMDALSPLSHYPAARWVPRDTIAQTLALSTLTKKVLAAIGGLS